EPRVTVYDGPPETLTGPVSVFVGQPRVPEFDAQPCMDRVEWPIAVVVEPGAAGNYLNAQRQLEALWPEIAEAYRAASEQDQSLSGLVAEWHVTRAEFGDFTIAGTSYPAQSIHLVLHG
uniref:hypothetical protein n=1 Tax=uncultured Aeromicrobium sp. TaxID=337820 RepID=UPI0025F47421